MNEARLHHYLPRFYLKLFSVNETQEIVLVNLGNKEITDPIHPNVCGAENLLYSFIVKGVNPNPALEKFFSVMDAGASRSITKLIRNPESLDGVDEQWILTFAAFQCIRVPKFLRLIKNQVEALGRLEVTRLSRDPATIEMTCNRLDFSKEQTARVRADLEDFDQRFKMEINRNHLLDMMFETFPTVYDLFRRMTWRLLISNATNYFITSDSPVVSFRRNSGTIVFGGFEWKDVEVTFPLSKHHCLRGAWSAESRFAGTKRVGRNAVNGINRRTRLAASKYLYCPVAQAGVSAMALASS
jgi:hypothetical protein